VGAERGADPGRVAYDALEAARRAAATSSIVDTAGALHTQTNLMDELAKVRRVHRAAARRRAARDAARASTRRRARTASSRRACSARRSR
jgi:signal recognition particle GTPase